MDNENPSALAPSEDYAPTTPCTQVEDARPDPVYWDLLESQPPSTTQDLLFSLEAARKDLKKNSRMPENEVECITKKLDFLIALLLRFEFEPISAWRLVLALLEGEDDFESRDYLSPIARRFIDAMREGLSTPEEYIRVYEDLDVNHDPTMIKEFRCMVRASLVVSNDTSCLVFRLGLWALITGADRRTFARCFTVKGVLPRCLAGAHSVLREWADLDEDGRTRVPTEVLGRGGDFVLGELNPGRNHS